MESNCFGVYLMGKRNTLRECKKARRNNLTCVAQGKRDIQYREENTMQETIDCILQIRRHIGEGGQSIAKVLVHLSKYPSFEEALDILALCGLPNESYPLVLSIQGLTSNGYPADYLLRQCVI